MDETFSHTRFHLALRTLSTPAIYHRLLLFRINATAVDSSGKDSTDGQVPLGGSGETGPELYCMEEACPHLGAPLSHGKLEVDDVEDTRAIGE